MTQTSITLTLLSILAAGCVARPAPADIPLAKQVMRGTLTEVRKYDGIDRREAVLLSQSEMLYRGRENSYRVKEPQIEETAQAWKVRFYPVIHTFKERKKHPVSEVTIDRKDGRIIFRDLWPES